VARVFESHGVAWSRYQTIAELVARDPECSSANPMFMSIDQPGVGTILTPGSPIDFQGTGRVLPQAAPRLGEHTEEVLAELLGSTGRSTAACATGAWSAQGRSAEPQAAAQRRPRHRESSLDELVERSLVGAPPFDRPVQPARMSRRRLFLCERVR